MILLTDKEINRLSEEWLDADEDVDWATMMNKAQLKKVMKWGIGFCHHKDGPLFRRECPHCWQVLLDEAKE